MKKSVDEQVALLTEAQRSSIKKIHKVQTVLTAIIVILVLAVIITAFILAQNAKISWQEAAARDDGTYESALEQFAAYDDFCEMRDFQKNATAVSIASFLVYVIVFEIVLIVKFPYYSEKKFAYIKRENL